MKNLNLDKQILFNFLIFFFPISFLVGRAIVELLLFVFFVTTLFYCKKWKDYFFDKNYITILLFSAVKTLKPKLESSLFSKSGSWTSTFASFFSRASEIL